MSGHWESGGEHQFLLRQGAAKISGDGGIVFLTINRQHLQNMNMISN